MEGTVFQMKLTRYLGILPALFEVVPAVAKAFRSSDAMTPEEAEAAAEKAKRRLLAAYRRR